MTGGGIPSQQEHLGALWEGGSMTTNTLRRRVEWMGAECPGVAARAGCSARASSNSLVLLPRVEEGSSEVQTRTNDS